MWTIPGVFYVRVAPRRDEPNRPTGPCERAGGRCTAVLADQSLDFAIAALGLRNPVIGMVTPDERPALPTAPFRDLSTTYLTYLRLISTANCFY
jgi:hypothetical protein